MVDGESVRSVAAVRRFNRFYTRQIGILQESYLRTPYTLSETRILYEFAHRDAATASQLGRDLDLDAGYLSRLLGSLEQRGLIVRRPSDIDRRQMLLSLTLAGEQAFAQANDAASADIESLLARLPESRQHELLDAMQTIELILGQEQEPRVPYILRPPHNGDFGWIVYRHGVLYSREYGWDERFEALVAGIVAEIITQFEPQRERWWIAERNGAMVGSVCLVRHREREGVARLRLLLVEPQARGLGIGSRLVQECTRFARGAGYHTITLWTNSALHAARRLYQAEGYRLVDEQPHHSYGHDLIGQTWELRL